MKRATLAGLVLFFFAFYANGQNQNFWQILAEVGYQSKRDKNGYQVEEPVFSKHLKSWNGKKIRLKGFVIPVNEVGDQDKFMLSSLPFNVCYFCGAAGPETVIEVESVEKIRFTSKAIWMEGTLQLNEKDPDRHMFILKAAHLITQPTASSESKTEYFSR
jgi:hypothetical protein